MVVKGSVFKYGDNVDTDVIIPARYLNIADVKELSSHAMEDIDADFVKKVNDGDIIVATRNFGCGSSREHAPLVIKENNVSCVIASSFARIFYRNAINIGLPILECEAAANAIEAGDIVSVEIDTNDRKTIFGDVVIRVRDDFKLAMHIDTDEANAANCKGEVFGKIIK